MNNPDRVDLPTLIGLLVIIALVFAMGWLAGGG